LKQRFSQRQHGTAFGGVSESEIGPIGLMTEALLLRTPVSVPAGVK